MENAGQFPREEPEMANNCQELWISGLSASHLRICCNLSLPASLSLLLTCSIPMCGIWELRSYMLLWHSNGEGAGKSRCVVFVHLRGNLEKKTRLHEPTVGGLCGGSEGSPSSPDPVVSQDAARVQTAGKHCAPSPPCSPHSPHAGLCRRAWKRLHPEGLGFMGRGFQGWGRALCSGDSLVSLCLMSLRGQWLLLGGLRSVVDECHAVGSQKHGGSWRGVLRGFIT